MTATSDASTSEREAVREDVIGGVDTHADTIHVALVSVLGRDLVDKEFATTPEGYADALEFLSSHGEIYRVGIEGTSSYGIGLSRAARAAGLEVTEVNRPDRAERRRIGKSDPIDAYQAAHAVLSGRATSAPKTEQIDALRALHVARRSAVKARTAAMNQIHQLLVTAPAPIREKYRALKEDAVVSALARCRPTTGTSGDLSSRMVLTALKAIAQRHEYLGAQADGLRREITVLVHAANPGLLATHGVGPDTAAQPLITAGGNPERLNSE
ncbi:MAG TPA: transposase [Nocardioidaceae bacterium]|nr:transposase [Nocardioidaceae bacterium]